MVAVPYVTFTCCILIILCVNYISTENDKCNTEECTSDDVNAMSSQALVLYDEAFVSPFHKESRSFTFVGKTLTIKQDWKSLGIAAVVWDAAIVLCEYLEKHKDVIHGKTVIELGAGSGIVGIVAALLGGKVTITDLDVALSYIHDVVDMNVKDVPNVDIQIKGLDWTKDRQAFTAEYDVVLGADIIYIEEIFEDLLKTFLQICDENTVILLSWRYRYDRDNKFLDMMREFFTLDQLLYDKPRDVTIFLGKLIIPENKT